MQAIWTVSGILLFVVLCIAGIAHNQPIQKQEKEEKKKTGFNIRIEEN